MSSIIHDSSLFIAELEVKQEFRILDALVAQPNFLIEDAIQQILSLSSASINSLGNQLYDTACCLLEIAARTPPVQQLKLVKFVGLLQKTTITNEATGEPLRHDGNLVWTDLPTFGYTFSDELGSFDPLDPKNTPDKNRRWENTTGFVAQLIAISDDMSLSLWALTAFQYAFGPWESATFSTDIAVRAACLWYVYAADRLWAHVKSDHKPDFEFMDWHHWKQSLINDQSKFTELGTRKLMEDALAEIKRVESGN